jgi:hypothetical protein
MSFDHPIYAQADAWLGRSKSSAEASPTSSKENTNHLAGEDAVGRMPMAAPLSPEGAAVLKKSKEGGDGSAAIPSSPSTPTDTDQAENEPKEVSLSCDERLPRRMGEAGVGSKSKDDFSPNHKLISSMLTSPSSTKGGGARCGAGGGTGMDSSGDQSPRGAFSEGLPADFSPSTFLKELR